MSKFINKMHLRMFECARVSLTHLFIEVLIALKEYMTQSNFIMTSTLMYIYVSFGTNAKWPGVRETIRIF